MNSFRSASITTYTEDTHIQVHDGLFRYVCWDKIDSVASYLRFLLGLLILEEHFI